MRNKLYDVCVIGAGVVGANIARELSRYDLQIAWLEKEEDVSCGCSKANSGIVHGGFADKPGSLRAKLCWRGNQMFEQLNRELNFGYRQTGSLVLAFSDSEVETLQRLYEQGNENGLPDLAILSADEVRQREPNVSKKVIAALYCPCSGVTSPYEMVIALAENAVNNGVRLSLQAEVIDLTCDEGVFAVSCSGYTIHSRYVINAAGIYSDKIAKFAEKSVVELQPRRGQYLLLAKPAARLVEHVIFQCPSQFGKGVLVAPTYHGNLLLGPNAEDINDKEDVATSEESLRKIIQKALLSVPAISSSQAITSFAGNRPYSGLADWQIAMSKELPGLLNLIGIDSPGLTASPAIALRVIDELQQAGLVLTKKTNFQPNRPSIIKPKTKDFRGDINSFEPSKRLVCRCEQVTAAEIIDAARRPVPARSIDAVKRRTRAGMGLCQGAFCRPRVRELMARTLGVASQDISMRGKDSPPLPTRLSGKELRDLDKV